MLGGTIFWNSNYCNPWEIQKCQYGEFSVVKKYVSWYQWPHSLRRRSAAARLLRLWVQIPPGAWMFVCCECCMLSGRGLCDELITRPEESYHLWYVIVCDLEISRMRRPWPALGRSTTGKKKYVSIYRMGSWFLHYRLIGEVCLAFVYAGWFFHLQGLYK